MNIYFIISSIMTLILMEAWLLYLSIFEARLVGKFDWKVFWQVFLISNFVIGWIVAIFVFLGMATSLCFLNS